MTDVWSNRAQAFRESPTHREGPDLDLLVEMCEPGGGVKALDVATGGGHVARRLREQGCDFVTVDPAPGMRADVVARAEQLPFDDGSFDVALMVMLLHHLVGERPDDLPRNARRALVEAHRVLAPGGRLVLVESCVPEWFARAEPALYRPLARWAATRGHPPTYQLPPRAVADQVTAVFGRCDRMERIPMGRWTVQMGRRWPVALTPARAWLFESRRA
jgi:SAM-dependent methyltransferase